VHINLDRQQAATGSIACLEYDDIGTPLLKKRRCVQTCCACSNNHNGVHLASLQSVCG